jgi:hypothetical protein
MNVAFRCASRSSRRRFSSASSAAERSRVTSSTVWSAVKPDFVALMVIVFPPRPKGCATDQRPFLSALTRFVCSPSDTRTLARGVLVPRMTTLSFRTSSPSPGERIWSSTLGGGAGAVAVGVDATCGVAPPSPSPPPPDVATTIATTMASAIPNPMTRPRLLPSCASAAGSSDAGVPWSGGGPSGGRYVDRDGSGASGASATSASSSDVSRSSPLGSPNTWAAGSSGVRGSCPSTSVGGSGSTTGAAGSAAASSASSVLSSVPHRAQKRSSISAALPQL